MRLANDNLCQDIIEDNLVMRHVLINRNIYIPFTCYYIYLSTFLL